MGEGHKNGRHHRRVKHHVDLDYLAGLCAKAGIPASMQLRNVTLILILSF
jgi:hypothetical protein